MPSEGIFIAPEGRGAFERPAGEEMGHRALVAYQREDELYTLHYSHWGAQHLRLKHEIAKETPFGGEVRHNLWASMAIDALQAGNREHLEHLLDQAERPETSVRVEPMATGLTVDEIVSERLDYLRYEAFCVVSTEFEVTAYRTLWFGLDDYCEAAVCSETVGNGALQTVCWYEGEPVGDGYVRGAFDAMKDVIGDMVDRDVFTLEEAIEYLKEKLTERADERADLIIRVPSKEEPTA